MPTAPVGEDVAISRDDFWTPVDQLNERGRQAAAELGCSAPEEGASGSHQEVLACLRELPAEELLPYATTFGIASGTATLPKNPGEAVADEQFHRVPVLSGSTRDESRYTTMLVEAVTGPVTGERYDALLEQAFGEHAGTIREAYPLDEYDNPGLAFAAMDTDRTWACPQLITNRALADEVPTYGYEFADRTAPTYGPFLTDMPPGAAHASELAYLFDLATGPWGPDFEEVELNAEQRALGDRMIKAWTRFAWTGRPTADAGSWPEFDTEGSPYVRPFVTRAEDENIGGGGANPWSDHHCDVWAELR